MVTTPSNSNSSGRSCLCPLIGGALLYPRRLSEDFVDSFVDKCASQSQILAIQILAGRRTPVPQFSSKRIYLCQSMTGAFPYLRPQQGILWNPRVTDELLDPVFGDADLSARG
ncbi:hypothetical protein QAD02_009608 [Eretmocerus hayati]|uniref:Uncharacterized protein n=1 Tax=Eretmocerus hayati TaxID=131215 RepID=A0ACC2N9T9_9HYME|nr:hypothetical protein QAD02_009608 [Eretmocerus hayati]